MGKTTIELACLSLVACKVSAEKSVDNLTRIPLYMILCFSLAAFRILFIF